MAVIAEPLLPSLRSTSPTIGLPRAMPGARRGAGAGRRQQHRHRRDHRHHRFGAGARSGAGDAADQRHGRGHVDRHDAGRHAGEGLRPALCPADRLGFRRAVRTYFLRGGVARIVLAVARSARCAAASTRRRISPIASPRPTPRARNFGPRRCPGCLPAAFSPRVIGPQLVIFTKDIWPTYLFAATFLAQSACAVLAAGVLTVAQNSAPARVAFARRRPAAVARSLRSRNSSSRSSAAWRATR